MPTYQYNARTKTGESRTGIIEARSEESALDILQQKGLVVTSLAIKGESIFNVDISFLSRVSQKDIVIFSRQIATLFEAQIPVVDALRTLIDQTEKPKLRAIISEILDDVTGGLALSRAMEKHRGVFSAFYINLVRSGEESGKLQEIFSYLADYLERSYAITSKARNAMIYPAFVFFTFVGVLVLMLVIVIPRLVGIFEDTGQEVPFYTQIVIFISNLLRNWGLLFLIIFIGSVLGLWRWGQTETGRTFFHTLQIRMPIFGGLYTKLYMARLTDNLRTLIVGGIPIIRALSITRDVVVNVVYQKAITDAIESVKGGSTISAAFERTPEIPVLVTHMIRIGEQAGRLDSILANISKFYQREVDDMVDNIVSLIEPALIIFLGAGVGILVASVLIPLYNLVGSI